MPARWHGWHRHRAMSTGLGVDLRLSLLWEGIEAWLLLVLERVQLREEQQQQQEPGDTRKQELPLMRRIEDRR